MTEPTDRSRGTPAEMLLWAVHDVTQVVMHRLRPSLVQLGISWEQFLTLHIISTHGSTTISDVAQHLAISPPTACVSVDRLEAARLVERRRSTHDQRSVKVRLTPLGHKVEQQVWRRVRRLTAHAAEDTSLDEVHGAVKVLEQLTDRLRRSESGETT